MKNVNGFVLALGMFGSAAAMADHIPAPQLAGTYTVVGKDAEDMADSLAGKWTVYSALRTSVTEYKQLRAPNGLFRVICYKISTRLGQPVLPRFTCAGEFSRDGRTPVRDAVTEPKPVG